MYRCYISPATRIGHVAAEHQALVVAHLEQTGKAAMKGRIKTGSIRYSPRAGGLECQLLLKFRDDVDDFGAVLANQQEYFID